MVRFIFPILLYVSFFFGSPIQANTADWMQEYAPYIENKSIKDITIPGTHDSATYSLEHTFGKGQDITHKLNHLKLIGIGFIVTAIAKNWSLAQNRSILQQLEDGYRFLDLRVIYRDSKKEFYTVHGLYGPSLKDVLNQINSFAAKHPKEIIIIQVGDLRYMPEGKGGHDQLLQELRAAFGNKLVSKRTSLGAKIKDLWAQNKQIILIYNKAPEKVAAFDDVWEESNFLESPWANATSTQQLKEKLDDSLMGRNSHMLYVIQSQLTPNTDTIINGLKVGTKNPKSLNALANMVKKELPQWLNDWKTKNPNIIIVDFGDQKTAESIIQLNKTTPLTTASAGRIDPATIQKQRASLRKTIPPLK